MTEFSKNLWRVLALVIAVSFLTSVITTRLVISYTPAPVATFKPAKSSILGPQKWNEPSTFAGSTGQTPEIYTTVCVGGVCKDVPIAK